MIVLDPSGAEPPSELVRAQVAAQVESGALRAGEAVLLVRNVLDHG